MEEEFGMRRWAIVAFALLAAVAIGVVAYQAGVSEGVSLQPPPVVTAPAAPGGQATPPVAYDYRYYRPWRFGFFGPLFSVLFFVFVLRALSWGVFGWGLGWGWRRRRWYYDHPDDYGPSRFDEWHRRAHERMRDDRTPSTPGA